MIWATARAIGMTILAVVGINIVVYSLLTILAVVFAVTFSNGFIAALVGVSLLMAGLTKLNIPSPFGGGKRINLVPIFPGFWPVVLITLMFTVGIYWFLGANLVDSLLRAREARMNSYAVEVNETTKRRHLYLLKDGAPVRNYIGLLRWNWHERQTTDAVWVYNFFDKRSEGGEILTRVIFPDVNGKYMNGDMRLVVESDLISVDHYTQDINKKLALIRAQEQDKKNKAAEEERRKKAEEKRKDNTKTVTVSSDKIILQKMKGYAHEYDVSHLNLKDGQYEITFMDTVSISDYPGIVDVNGKTASRKFGRFVIPKGYKICWPSAPTTITLRTDKPNIEPISIKIEIAMVSS